MGELASVGAGNPSIAGEKSKIQGEIARLNREFATEQCLRGGLASQECGKSGTGHPFLPANGAILLAMALVDWTKPYVSLGFLYLFPIILAAGFLPRWAIGSLGSGCAILAEVFSSLDRSFNAPGSPFLGPPKSEIR